jgi:hypothetical protein
MQHQKQAIAQVGASELALSHAYGLDDHDRVACRFAQKLRFPRVPRDTTRRAA